ncbi:response regulator [Pseudaeromonas pectinilytica]
MRVLLIEDDPMIGDAIQGALKDASYAADWVKSGPSGITALSCQHYDLVLLDLGLPGKDGLEVLANIRASGNAIPLLIMGKRIKWLILPLHESETDRHLIGLSG